MRIISQDKTVDINYDNFTIYVKELTVPDSGYGIYACSDYCETEVKLAGPMSYEKAKSLLANISVAYHFGKKYFEL